MGIDTGILCPERNPMPINDRILSSGASAQPGVLGERLASAGDVSHTRSITELNRALPGAGNAATTSVGEIHARVGGDYGESKPAIGQWSIKDKFADVLRRTAPKLPGELRIQFLALLTPLNLGIMVATLVAWAGSQFFGVGEIIDLLLLAVGSFFLGMAVFTVAKDLWGFLHGTVTATTELDLDKAALSLAEAIAIMGVAAFVALLSKMGAKLREKPVPSASDQAETATPRPASHRQEPDLSSNAKKGVFGEATADAYMRQHGFEKLNGSDVQIGDAPTGNGIDGIYKNSNPPPEYVIGEAKFGKAQLGTLKDGTKQMSDQWIGRRLYRELAPEDADSVRDSMTRGQTEKWLLKVDDQGNVSKIVLK